MNRGKYITIEGGEGSGKTSQTKSLVDYLTRKGIRAEYFREPGGTPTSEEIRAVILGGSFSKMHSLTELFLFEAARVEVFDKIVIPGLRKGKTMVSDRSFYSTLAYQGYARGIDLDLIKKLNLEATFGVIPDLAIFIDIPLKKGLEKQVTKDRIGAEGRKFHKKVNDSYRQIAKENPGIILLPYVEGDAEEMQEEIRKHADNLFSS